jgi:hypothetical protein
MTILNSEAARATAWPAALITGATFILQELNKAGDPDWTQILIGAALFVLIGGGGELTRSKVYSADSFGQSEFEASLHMNDTGEAQLVVGVGGVEHAFDLSDYVRDAVASLPLPDGSYVVVDVGGSLQARTLDGSATFGFDGHEWTQEVEVG